MRYVQAEIDPMARVHDWSVMFVLETSLSYNEASIHLDDPDSILYPIFSWCEERFGSHYGAGMKRFWFMPGHVLFRDENDAIEFKMRWG